MFVDLVDARIRGPHFDDLRTDLRNETPIAGPAGRRQLGLKPGFRQDGGLHCAHQGAGGRQKGQATNRPGQFEVQAMAFEHFGQTPLQAVRRGLG